MDTRTMIRELDEVIARVRCEAASREALLLDTLPDCGLRRRKEAQLRMIRAHAQQLEKLRRAVKARVRPGTLLN